MLCYSELKRRLKAEQKAKEKAEKEQVKQEAAAKENDGTGHQEKKKSNAEEDISPNVGSLLDHISKQLDYGINSGEQTE